MKYIINILLISLFIFCFSCSKYEEGPFFSFKSPERRLLGLWEFTSLKIDSIDYISTYKEDSTYVRFSIIYYDDLFINIVKEGRSSPQLSSSILKLEDKKRFMKFHLKQYAAYQSITNPIYNLIPPLDHENSWEIIKLKSDQFIIQLYYENMNYSLSFDRLEKY